MAETRVEIASKVTIKPSSPTPNHLQHFKLSLLDEIAFPPFVYLPFTLFYSAPDHEFPKISQKLRTSLSEILTLYYPLCGKIKGNKGNLYVDCNDEGVLYLESRVPSKLSDFLKSNTNQQLKQIKGFLPLDPYQPKLDDDDEDRLVTAVQVTEFGCGGIAIGVCVSHKVCDATAVASFLKAWSQKAIGEASEAASSLAPHMEASLLFPPMGIEVDINDMIGCGFKPTKVEAVTTLIWKSAMEAARTAEKTHKSSSFMIHAVNIRGRMQPPLPENSLGNIFLSSFSPLLEVDKETKVELQDLAEVVRKTIQVFNGDYLKKKVPCYYFSSQVRMGLHETDFGWGKPAWACPVGIPARNVIILRPAPSGDGGIEAWVNLNEHHMPHFESNPLLLQFASFDP
ncbi:hypothetical protein K1719_040811 [Acacia pycnantha]|nr:hypothetical protein K1719_040811 [Acacia pycnantha]